MDVIKYLIKCIAHIDMQDNVSDKFSKWCHSCITSNNIYDIRKAIRHSIEHVKMVRLMPWNVW